ncbi:MAG: tRNA (guanosine(37)-N1)-methyltransferase TrmD [Anaerolineales bacterium]
MRFDVVTLFPEMFLSPLQESILGRAQQRGLVTIYLHQLRDYAFDRHQMTDDVPYGGGVGMVMKPEPVFRAVERLSPAASTPIILLSPQGRPLDQEGVRAIGSHPRLILICGHYEGFDERIREHLVTDEISIGDYVLTGGELAAMVVIDAVVRWLPGVLGDEESARQDSHARGLLEGPQYTRPAGFRDWEVPEVLRSGNHAAIARWKRRQALQRTRQRRPDLLDGATLTEAERALLEQSNLDDEPYDG